MRPATPEAREPMLRRVEPSDVLGGVPLRPGDGRWVRHRRRWHSYETLVRPRLVGLVGDGLEVAAEQLQALEGAIAAIDAQVGDLAAERRALVEDLVGLVQAVEGSLNPREHLRRRTRIADVVPRLPRSAHGLRPLSGTALRSVLESILEGAAGRSLTLGELDHHLTARGLTTLPGARPPKAISDALRASVHRGAVERVARGEYRWRVDRREAGHAAA